MLTNPAVTSLVRATILPRLDHMLPLCRPSTPHLLDPQGLHTCSSRDVCRPHCPAFSAGPALTPMPEIAVPNTPHPPPYTSLQLNPFTYTEFTCLLFSFLLPTVEQNSHKMGTFIRLLLLLPAPQSLAWAWHTAGPRESVTEVLTFLGSQNSAL